MWDQKFRAGKCGTEDAGLEMQDQKMFGLRKEIWSANDISSLNSQKYLYAFGVILRKTKLKFDEQ